MKDKEKLFDILYVFINHYEKFYKNGNPYKNYPVDPNTECIIEFIENNKVNYVDR